MTRYSRFKKKYLIQNFCNKKGEPKHTRLVKDQFYKYAIQLRTEYGLDMFRCSCCGIGRHNGRNIVLELDHINGVTNDSRIENLRILCPNCHSQTAGYKNRQISVEDYVHSLYNMQTPIEKDNI